MWHKLIDIANHRRLDFESLLEFATFHSNKYSIVDNAVNTWHVDELLRSYRNAKFFVVGRKPPKENEYLKWQVIDPIKETTIFYYNSDNAFPLAEAINHVERLSKKHIDGEFKLQFCNKE